jgi:hypothetical protein
LVEDKKKAGEGRKMGRRMGMEDGRGQELYSYSFCFKIAQNSC